MGRWVIMALALAPLVASCSAATDRPIATPATRGAAEPPAGTSPVASPRASPERSSGVVTSADDPAEPVPFRWTTRRSAAPDGHRLVLQGGTIHAIADSARLLDPRGQVVATAPAAPVSSSDLCPGGGVVRAELPLAPELLPLFEAEAWPPGYRVEALVGGRWRSTALTFAGCRL